MHSPKQDYSLTLHQVDADETVLAIIKRHPFGIFKIYVQSAFGIVLAGGLMVVLLPGLLSRDDYPGVYDGLIVGGIAILMIMVVLLVIATIIYYLSLMTITDKTITLTIQNGIFNKKVSQLSIASVEDVTAVKNGFFATMFNFGRLTIETAGEQENFHFDYCGHPDHYAKLILEARQTMMSSREMDRREENKTNVTNQQPANYQ